MRSKVVSRLKIPQLIVILLMVLPTELKCPNLYAMHYIIAHLTNKNFHGINTQNFRQKRMVNKSSKSQINILKKSCDKHLTKRRF